VQQLEHALKICGNGYYDSYNYECDDGNNVSGDGCDSLAALSTGMNAIQEIQ